MNKSCSSSVSTTLSFSSLSFLSVSSTESSTLVSSICVAALCSAAEILCVRPSSGSSSLVFISPRSILISLSGPSSAIPPTFSRVSSSSAI